MGTPLLKKGSAACPLFLGRHYTYVGISQVPSWAPGPRAADVAQPQARLGKGSVDPFVWIEHTMVQPIPDATHGTAIYAYIGVAWGVQCRHIWQSHGVFGITYAWFFERKNSLCDLKQMSTFCDRCRSKPFCFNVEIWTQRRGNLDLAVVLASSEFVAGAVNRELWACGPWSVWKNFGNLSRTSWVLASPTCLRKCFCC